MTTSLAIARVLGPVYAIIGLGLLLNPQHYRDMIADFSANRAVRYIGAFLAMIFGSIILTLHPVWSGWPLIITLLGVGGFLKGASLILAPGATNSLLATLSEHPATMRGAGLFALLAGVLLTALGFNLL